MGKFDFEVNQELCGDSRMMHPDVFEKLKKSIADNGIFQNRKIDIWYDAANDKWSIVDGRHRYHAAKEVGHEFDEEDFTRLSGQSLDEMRDIVAAWAIRKGSTNNRSKEEKRKDGDKVVKSFHPKKSMRWMSEHTGLSTTCITAAINRAIPEDDQNSNGVLLNGLSNTMPESPTSPPMAPIEPEIVGSKAEIIETVPEPEVVKLENPIYDSAALSMLSTLFPDMSNPGKHHRKPLETILATKLGKNMMERYDGSEAPDGMKANIRAGLIDLRIGWKHLGRDWAKENACLPTQHNLSKFVKRMDDLDLINAENAGAASEFKKSNNTTQYWEDMRRLTSRAKKGANVTNIKEGQRLKWHGVSLPYLDVEGMDYKTAHCITQLVFGIYSMHFIDMGKAGHEIVDQDIRNFAQDLRKWGDFIEGFAGKEARKLIIMMASAMEKNPGEVQKQGGGIPHATYHTHQGTL